MSRTLKTAVVTTIAIASAFLTAATFADHHLMQIHQVIGGVNGDASAQAVQLRMRGPFQNQMQNGKLWAFDATGANPVLLIDFDSPVTNQGAGVTVLVATQNFIDQTNPTCEPDFIMDAIPEAYLAAGSLTFENNAGTSIWWRLSWGGDNYSGPTNGDLTNDADGDFGKWPGPLPSTTLQALLYQRAANTRSNNNAADYAVTAGAAVFTNNAAENFTVVGSAEPVDICADTATVERGIRIGGDFGNLCESDDVDWSFQPDAFSATLVAPIRVDLRGTYSGLGDATSYQFRMEVASNANGLGGVLMRIEAFNYATNLFEGTVFVNIPEIDTEFLVTKATGAGNYIEDATGEIRAQVSFTRPAGVPPFWTIGMDRGYWTIE